MSTRTHLPKSRLLEKQKSYRSDAERFFHWCSGNLRACVAQLGKAGEKEYLAGEFTGKLLTAVRAAWSKELKTNRPTDEQAEVIQKALPDYLRIWLSRERAWWKLFDKALDVKTDEEGRINDEKYFLREVAANGSAALVEGLRDFLGGVVPEIPENGGRIVFVRDKNSIWESETRLNGFLKRLARELESAKKRRATSWQPDWLSIDPTLRCIVYCWCGSITKDGERWPPLCFFTTRALVQFLQKNMYNVTDCNLSKKDARSIEKDIQRYGLVRIPRGRIKHVQKMGGKFHFS